ncbi:Protein of unknown function DUF3425 [Penicillium cf. griseofulvum]|nr:Protein of unknown function DUF3425 [Penicillium cf. griseofulvum]
MSSNEKKRLRDRRSQQTLREKKLRHVAKLEEQVAHCEQHHSDEGVQHLLQVINGLRKQNEALITRQRSLKSLVNSWETELDEPAATYDSPHDLSSLFEEISNREAQFSLQTNFNEPMPQYGISSLLNTPMSTSSTPPQIQSQFMEPLSAETTPPWKQIPPHTDNFSTRTNISCPWFIPELILPCPDVPDSPLDLLYGTETNPPSRHDPQGPATSPSPRSGAAGYWLADLSLLKMGPCAKSGDLWSTPCLSPACAGADDNSTSACVRFSAVAKDEAKPDSVVACVWQGPGLSVWAPRLLCEASLALEREDS